MKDYKELQNGTDIRGTAVKLPGGREINLTPEACRDLAWAFSAWLSAKCCKTDLVIAVGRDCRVSGGKLSASIKDALEEIGVTVYDLGLCTTPAAFMATQFELPNADGAIEITASHLPMERNGLKFFTKNGGLEKEDISFLITMAESMQDELEFNSKKGKIYSIPFLKQYSEHLKGIICKELNASEGDKPLSGLKIVVDAGNGCGGFYVSNVLQPLGADCTGSLYLDPDGNFPNHIPNPEDKTAIKCICDAVIKNGADLGLIFDTDVDRAAAVGSDGREIARNRIVALAAILASENAPKTTVVTDSITSPQLKFFLENKLGLVHFRYKRGYKNVIDKGLELNALGTDCRLAIETSGHAALKENYFLDDGAYLAAKIVVKAARLKKEGKTIESLLSELADPLEAREVRFELPPDNFADYAQAVLDRIEKAAESVEGWSLEKPNYEGVRVLTDCGWFLIRKSLHDPVIPLNIESDVPGGCDKMLIQIEEILKDFIDLKR